MRTFLSNLFNPVWKLKFSSKFSTFTLYISSFLVVEFGRVFFVLYSFLTGFILSRSINDYDMYKLHEPVSKSGLHFSAFNFIITIRYVT